MLVVVVYDDYFVQRVGVLKAVVRFQLFKAGLAAAYEHAEQRGNVDVFYGSRSVFTLALRGANIGPSSLIKKPKCSSRTALRSLNRVVKSSR